jgi:hypothetical protein
MAKYKFEDYEAGYTRYFKTKDALIDYLVYLKIGESDWEKIK